MAEISGSRAQTFTFSRVVGRCAFLAMVLLALGGCDRSSPPDEGDTSADTAEVKYGSKVGFGAGGGSERLRVSGWSKTEDKFSWTEGTTAVLRTKVAATKDSVTLRMRLSGLKKEPELPFQPVEVSINDQKIADWEVGDINDFVVAIPHDMTSKGGELTITLKIPKATSPKALGVTSDPRVLGICCHELELTKG